MVYEVLIRERGSKVGCKVLILVFVEDGLREIRLFCEQNNYSYVLILVFVEDGLRAVIKLDYKSSNICLNPCFCGRWSTRGNSRLFAFRLSVLILVFVEDGLRGGVSRRQDLNEAHVLILVFVEDGLRGKRNIILLPFRIKVLILVFVEDGLRVHFLSTISLVRIVLILVFVEDGLRVGKRVKIETLPAKS